MARKSTKERRREITDGLLEAMAEHGYAKASIKRIAESAGVTPGLIHYHFDSKQAILLELLRRLLDPLLEELQALVDTDDSATSRLEALIDALLATGDSAQPEAVAVWVTMGAEAIREPEINQAYSQALAKLQGLFVQVIESGIEGGEFDLGQLSAPACAAALLATVEGYFTLAATSPDTIPRGTAAPATRQMLQGLLQQQSSAPAQ